MKALVTLLLLTQLAWAQTTPDYGKETRWAAQVEDGLMDGDVLWLEASGREFLTIFTESETESKKAAVVIHGLGVHPDWGQVIQPLRVALTTQGFNTLSLQMPVLANGVEGSAYRGLFSDADRRIAAAVKHLQAEGFEIDVLVAHSLGATMSSHYLAGNAHPFKRYVAVGMNGGATPYLPKSDVPVFDLYGDEDIAPVLDSVADRAAAAKHNANYTQKKVPADHFFNDKDELLTEEVGNWLK